MTDERTLQQQDRELTALIEELKQAAWQGDGAARRVRAAENRLHQFIAEIRTAPAAGSLQAAPLRRRTVNGRTDGRPRRRCAGCDDELHAGDDALVQEAVFWGTQCGCADKVEAAAAPVAESPTTQESARAAYETLAPLVGRAINPPFGVQPPPDSAAQAVLDWLFDLAEYGDEELPDLRVLDTYREEGEHVFNKHDAESLVSEQFLIEQYATLREDRTRLRGRITLAARALVEKDAAEAYHQLYAAADPHFQCLDDPFSAAPWREPADELRTVEDKGRAEPPTRQPGFEATYREILLRLRGACYDRDSERVLDIREELDAHVLGSPAAQPDAPLPECDRCGACGKPLEPQEGGSLFTICAECWATLPDGAQP